MAKRKEKEPFPVVMLYKLGGAEKYHGIECTSDVFDDEDDFKEALAGEWFESPQAAKEAAAKKAPAKKPAQKSALGDQAKDPASEHKRAHKEDGTFKADDPATKDVNEAFEE